MRLHILHVAAYRIGTGRGSCAPDDALPAPRQLGRQPATELNRRRTFGNLVATAPSSYRAERPGITNRPGIEHDATAWPFLEIAPLLEEWAGARVIGLSAMTGPVA
jgi:hypothetical protein